MRVCLTTKGDKTLIPDELGMSTGCNIQHRAKQMNTVKVGPEQLCRQVVSLLRSQRHSALILARQEVAHGDLWLTAPSRAGIGDFIPASCMAPAFKLISAY